MAEMIPDRLPSGASAGENRVFKALQALPDNCLVYYEPVVDRRYPDFVIIMPSVGLLVIEVKGWYPNSIQAASRNQVEIVERGQVKHHQHPSRQARDYKFRLMDVARKHPSTSLLLHQDKAHEGRFLFPFGHAVLLSNCNRQQLDERSFSEIFPASEVIARDEFDALEALTSAEIVAFLKQFFAPWWAFQPLNAQQVDVLRSIIHPVIRITSASPISDQTEPLKVMDIRQERSARSVGDGHRVVYGVAGSGKTIILIARARMLAEADKKLLILCYNTALAHYFQRNFDGAANVVCRNFHKWGTEQGIEFDDDEDRFGDRLLTRLKDGYGDANAYDAVFIDEAQDFARAWFECAKWALKEPDDGDLLIVGDGTQSLYRRRRFSWREAGVNAVGRTINKRFDLDRNYRNTRQILELAAKFARVAEGADPEDALPIVAADPTTAMRDGPRPEVTRTSNYSEFIKQKIAEWRKADVEFSQIAVLYSANVRHWIDDLVRDLSKSVPVNWVRAPRDWPHLQTETGVTISTMHSAKGLQWKGVILAGADLMPFIPRELTSPDEREQQERLERGLMYVALTRAEDRLAVAFAAENGFAAELSQIA